MFLEFGLKKSLCKSRNFICENKLHVLLNKFKIHFKDFAVCKSKRKKYFVLEIIRSLKKTFMIYTKWRNKSFLTVFELSTIKTLWLFCSILWKILELYVFIFMKMVKQSGLPYLCERDWLTICKVTWKLAGNVAKFDKNLNYLIKKSGKHWKLRLHITFSIKLPAKAPA